MKNCTVSKTKSGRYFVSIQCEMEIEDPTPKIEAMGIDLGLTTFASLSNGENEQAQAFVPQSATVEDSPTALESQSQA